MSTPLKPIILLAFFALATGCVQTTKDPGKKIPPLEETVRARTAQVEPELMDELCTVLNGDSSCVTVSANDRSSYSICIEVYNSYAEDTMILEKLQVVVHDSNGSIVKDTCRQAIRPTVILPDSSVILTVPYCMREDFTFQLGDTLVFNMDAKGGLKSESKLVVCTINPGELQQ